MDERIRTLQRAALQGDRSAGIQLYAEFQRVASPPSKGFYQIWPKELKRVWVQRPSGATNLTEVKRRRRVSVEGPDGKDRRFNVGQFYSQQIYVQPRKEQRHLGISFSSGYSARGITEENYEVTYLFDPREGDFVRRSRTAYLTWMHQSREIEDMWELDSPPHRQCSTERRNTLISKLLVVYAAAEAWMADNESVLIQAAVSHAHSWCKRKFSDAESIIYKHQQLMTEFHESTLSLWDYPMVDA